MPPLFKIWEWPGERCVCVWVGLFVSKNGPISVMTPCLTTGGVPILSPYAVPCPNSCPESTMHSPSSSRLFGRAGGLFSSFSYRYSSNLTSVHKSSIYSGLE